MKKESTPYYSACIKYFMGFYTKREDYTINLPKKTIFMTLVWSKDLLKRTQKTLIIKNSSSSRYSVEKKGKTSTRIRYLQYVRLTKHLYVCMYLSIQKSVRKN